jgi:long-chain fatty acid transport protein
MKNLCAAIVVLAMTIQGAAGSGYQVLLQGNRTTGMGNLSVALNNDVSSIFFNPGATALLDHNGVMAGINLIYSSNKFWNSSVENSNYTAVTASPTGTPIHAYAAWGPQGGRWKAGLAFVTPFGSGVSWGEGWIGRDLLTEISLRALQLQPTFSYKITDRLGVGAGLTIGFGSIDLSRALFINGQDGEGMVELSGTSSVGYGYNIGLFYALSEKIDIGISYRSKVELSVEDGDAMFEVPSSLALLVPGTNTFNATLPLPSTINAGITFHVTEKLDIGTEFNWVAWSAYDSLIIDFQTNTAGVSDSRSPRRYEDSWVLHLGAEYRATDDLQLRAGAYYDTTPVQKGYMTAETPDANRIGLTLGVGYTLGEHLQFDLSFLYINGKTREQTVEDVLDAGTYDPETGSRDVMPGTYKLNALIPGLSVSYRF